MSGLLPLPSLLYIVAVAFVAFVALVILLRDPAPSRRWARSRRSRPRPASGAWWCDSPTLVVGVVLISVALSGCGFQPRGSLALPGEVRIEGGPFELREALRVGLTGSGARVAGTALSPPASGATPAPGMLVVAITDADFSEQLVTVEPRFGTAREYRITLHVRYRVHGAEPDIAPGEVMLEREYRRHPGERARTGPERAQIEGEMLQEAARAILRRLHVLTRAG